MVKYCLDINILMISFETMTYEYLLKISLTSICFWFICGICSFDLRFNKPMCKDKADDYYHRKR